MLTSLLLKKCLAAPIIDLTFWIHALISAPSFNSVVIMDPRYLKLCVNCIDLVFGRGSFGGSMFPSVSVLASLRYLGKSIASVLDFMFSFSTCICMLRCSNCFMRTGVMAFSLSRSSIMNTLSSTKKNC